MESKDLKPGMIVLTNDLTCGELIGIRDCRCGIWDSKAIGTSEEIGIYDSDITHILFDPSKLPPQEPVRIVAMAYDPVNHTMDFALSNGTVWGYSSTDDDAEPFQYAEVRDGKMVAP